MVKKKGDIKQRLIDAAIKVIGENGFRKTTVPMITKRAGIGTGTFYLYFKDKSHVFIQAIIYVSSNLRGYLDEIFQKKIKSLNKRKISSKKVETILYIMYSTFFDYVDKYRNQFIVLFREGYSYKEEFAGILWEVYKNLADGTRRRLLTATQLNAIKPLTGEETEIIAWAMVGMLSQVAQLYIADSHDREKLINILVDFTIDGIRKGGGVK